MLFNINIKLPGEVTGESEVRCYQYADCALCYFLTSSKSSGTLFMGLSLFLNSLMGWIKASDLNWNPGKLVLCPIIQPALIFV